MPRRLTQTKVGTHQALKNTSYESTVVSWLMHDGWQVFLPILDNGHQTDILISDGPNYYRIQVKTVEASGDAPDAVETELLSHTMSEEIISGYEYWKKNMGGPLAPIDVSNAILCAYNQPQNVCIREIVLAATKQQP